MKTLEQLSQDVAHMAYIRGLDEAWSALFLRLVFTRTDSERNAILAGLNAISDLKKAAEARRVAA